MIPPMSSFQGVATAYDGPDSTLQINTARTYPVARSKDNAQKVAAALHAMGLLHFRMPQRWVNHQPAPANAAPRPLLVAPRPGRTTGF